MAAELGAHEVMEIHEVLNDTIDGINQFQLYQPHVKDSELQNILERQLHFMKQEYNNIVQTISHHQVNRAVPYRTPKDFSPNYGLKNPSSQSPNHSVNELDDRDISSGMMGCHKASAALRMAASLECADPTIRRMLQQGAVNCSEQAYEIWQYMNQKGYYQVPTMKNATTSTVIGSYARHAGEHVRQYQI